MTRGKPTDELYTQMIVTLNKNGHYPKDIAEFTTAAIKRQTVKNISWRYGRKR